MKMMFRYYGKDIAGNQIWKRRTYSNFDEILVISSELEPRLFTDVGDYVLSATVMSQKTYNFAKKVLRGEICGNSGI